MTDLPCAVPGCTTEIVGADGRRRVIPSPRKGEQPLCARHWYRVPRELRLRLWAHGSIDQSVLHEVVAAASDGRP